MQCQVCYNHSDKFYCSNCVKTSPQLITTLKFKLLTINDTNQKLNRQIDSILKQSLNKDSNGKTLNHGGILLKQRMSKVHNLKVRKNIGQLRIRLENMTNNIKNKRQYIAKLRGEVEEIKTHNPKSIRYVSGNISQDQMEQIERVVTKRQEQSIEMLNEWFIINKTRSRDIPYTICFEPIISARISSKLTTNVVRDSTFKLFQYLTIRAKLLSLVLPYPIMKIDKEKQPSIDDNSPSEYTMYELIQLRDRHVMEHIAIWLTRITFNIVFLCQYNGTLPPPYIPIDIAYLVDQIDVDGLLYGLYTGQIPNRNKYILTEPHITTTHSRFQDILLTIEQLLDSHRP